LSGSRIERALLCPGSIQLEATCPDTKSEAAQRGTLIHETADALFLDLPTPEGADAEIVAEAADYVRAIKDYTQGWAKKTFPEFPVNEGLKTIHKAMGGTADYVAIGGGRLLVADLKTGSVPVSPKYSPQLMTYALGVVKQLKAPPTITVELAIWQRELKVWECTYADLMEWEQTLKELAVRVFATDPIRTPSSDACQWCRAKTVCPELAAKAKDIATAAAVSDFGMAQAAQPAKSTKDVPPWEDLPPDQPVAAPTITPEMVNDAELVAMWAEAIKDTARAQLMAGKPIAGWTMKKGRKMIKLADMGKAMDACIGKSEAWELISPTKLQKLGILSDDHFIESNAAPSIVRVKE
jgi:hypothetical protein